MRTGRLEKIFVLVVVVGSAVGVIGWYMMTNRTGLKVDVSGFDLNAAPGALRRSVAAASRLAPIPTPSGLGMLKGKEDYRPQDQNASAPVQQAAPAAVAAVPAASKTKAAPPKAVPIIHLTKKEEDSQSKASADVMNNPEVQKALQQQGQQAPPVSLPGQ